PLGGGISLRPIALAWIAAVGACAWAMRKTRVGRDVYALGGDAEAARLLGVNVRATRLSVYAFAGACSALAGIVFTVYVGSASSIAGVGLELESIAAAVVGGVELAGGRGGLFGAAIGVLIFGA